LLGALPCFHRLFPVPLLPPTSLLRLGNFFLFSLYQFFRVCHDRSHPFPLRKCFFPFFFRGDTHSAVLLTNTPRTRVHLLAPFPPLDVSTTAVISPRRCKSTTPDFFPPTFLSSGHCSPSSSLKTLRPSVIELPQDVDRS